MYSMASYLLLNCKKRLVKAVMWGPLHSIHDQHMYTYKTSSRMKLQNICPEVVGKP